jgi:hypothetical protein
MATALILSCGGLPVAFGGQAGIDPASLAVAQTYFSALQSGDRQALLSLLAGKALTRSEAQLNDPAYSQFLAERYRNAWLEVTDGGVINGISYVDIIIWMNETESVRERLILKPSDDPSDPSLHIVARKELLD